MSQVPSAVSFSNGKPVWDFTETTAYPVEIQQGSKSITVQVYLTPYSADELKQILKKAVSGYRREKRDVEIVREDKAIYAPMCDAHFVKLGNTTGTPEAQKAWLDTHPEFKPSIVEFSFGGLRVDQKDEDAGDDEMLDISLELSSAVPVYQEIYDPSTEKTVRIDMQHNHSQPTERQYREYRAARRSRFLRKQTLWTITEAHGTLEKLYDEVIQGIDGAAVKGKPCTMQSKMDWLSSVPLWHKLWVCDQIFGELVEKNA